MNRLSEREIEVLELMAQKGFCYKKIAEILNIACSTLRCHIDNIYTKLGFAKSQDEKNKDYNVYARTIIWFFENKKESEDLNV